MRKFEIYKSVNGVKIRAEKPMCGEYKDLEIHTKRSIIGLVDKLVARNHIFDQSFWLDGEQFFPSQMKNLEQLVQDTNQEPTAEFYSQKDMVTLSKFASML